MEKPSMAARGGRSPTWGSASNELGRYGFSRIGEAVGGGIDALQEGLHKEQTRMPKGRDLRNMGVGSIVETSCRSCSSGMVGVARPNRRCPRSNPNPVGRDPCFPGPPDGRRTPNCRLPLVHDVTKPILVGPMPKYREYRVLLRIRRQHRGQGVPNNRSIIPRWRALCHSHAQLCSACFPFRNRGSRLLNEE